MMSEAEVSALVDAVVAELGATSLKDMGKCMGAMQVGVLREIAVRYPA